MGQCNAASYLKVRRFSSSYSSFLARLGEVEALRRIARRHERTNPVGLAPEISALCRGAIVLLSSHVEAFIKELGELALDALYSKRVDRSKISPRILYHSTRPALSQIKRAESDDDIAREISRFLSGDAILWSGSGPMPRPISAEIFSHGFSNPGTKKVKSYFGRFGYLEFQRDFRIKLRSDAQSIENALDHLVAIRNSIAHGDPSATKTPAEITDLLTAARIYCRTVDDLFCSWFRQGLCAIR